MSSVTDHHFEQMLLGLMPPRPRARHLYCRACGQHTRHTVGFCKDPQSRQVGSWFSKCVLCDSPLNFITLPLSRGEFNIVTTYHATRQDLVNSRMGGVHHWSDRDEYDIDGGIRGEFYETFNTAVPIEFCTDNFPVVSMWDCSSIRRRYKINTRFQVFNPTNGEWQVVSGQTPFAFVPFTPVVVKLHDVEDNAFVEASVQEARQMFANAIDPAPAPRRRKRAVSPQPRTPPPGRPRMAGDSSSSVSSSASSIFEHSRPSGGTDTSPIRHSSPRPVTHGTPTMESPAPSPEGDDGTKPLPAPPPSGSEKPAASQSSAPGEPENSEAPKKTKGRAHTSANCDPVDGFSTISPHPTCERRFADCVSTINANAYGGRALAHRVHLLEQGLGAGQDARCIQDMGALEHRVEQLAREVQTLQRDGESTTMLSDQTLDDVRTDVAALKKYSAQLAELFAVLSGSLIEKGDEIAELRAQCVSLRAQRNVQTVLSTLPPLPSVAPLSATLHRGTRARSPAAQAGPSNRPDKRARMHPPLYALTIGSSAALAKSKQIYQDVVKILDTLQNAFKRAAPYAVEVNKKDPGFVLVFFEDEASRKLVVENWPQRHKDHKDLSLHSLEGIVPSEDAAIGNVIMAQLKAGPSKR